MKKNKAVIFAIVSAFVVGIFATGYFLIESRCTLDGESVCFDKESSQFKIEENANLIVQVENEELGEFLVETWDTLHPDNKGAIETAVQEPLSIKELSQGFPYDIMVTNQSNASYFLDDLRDLQNDLGEVVGSRIPSQLQDAINLKGYYFVQNSIDGWYFVYNETLLKEMGFSMDSETGYGLPTELDSWEKIFDNGEEILKKSDYVFPLTFADQTSFYPFLTGGRWTLNFTQDGSEPGFDSREFREGLELIEAFRDNEFYKEEPVLEEKPSDKDEKPGTIDNSEVQDNKEDNVLTDSAKPEENKDKDKDIEVTDNPDSEDNAEEIPETNVSPETEGTTAKELLPWMYEEAFYNRETPFTMLHSSMQFEAYREQMDDEYKVAPFPSFNEHHLAPMGEVNGYMVNKTVRYPSASAEVIRILRSPDALKVYESSDDKVPVYSRSYFDELDLGEDVMDKILAYNYHDTPSVLALDNNPSKLTRSVYDEINFMDIFENIYLDKVTIEEAQHEVVKRVDSWLEEYDVSEEEETE